MKSKKLKKKKSWTNHFANLPWNLLSLQREIREIKSLTKIFPIFSASETHVRAAKRAVFKACNQSIIKFVEQNCRLSVTGVYNSYG